MTSVGKLPTSTPEQKTVLGVIFPELPLLFVEVTGVANSNLVISEISRKGLVWLVSSRRSGVQIFYNPI